MADTVRYDINDGVAVITIDNPPVNALSPGVPDGITAAVDRGNADPSVKAMVLIGAGRSFIAGADIRAFGTDRPRLPLGERVYDVLDASEKPVVAAIHGYALGAGCEMTMYCDLRLASDDARFGLPETTLGYLPTAGGSQTGSSMCQMYLGRNSAN